MSVKTYSLKKYGRDYKLSDHFSLGEFACNDGSDSVKVSTELITMLEKLRSYGNFSIIINSGYRTPSYNKRIGGASASQHIYGTAADVVVKKDGKTVNGKLICCLCQTLGFKGVAWISNNSTHLDMRSKGTYRGFEGNGYGNNVGGDFYKYFKISKSQIEALKVQQKEEDKGDDDEMTYATINDIPEWGKAAAQLRIDHKWTDGKNITDSMLRTWVINDREDPYIANLEDAPDWAKPEAQELINKGYIKGNGNETIGMRLSDLRVCIITGRMK